MKKYVFIIAAVLGLCFIGTKRCEAGPNNGLFLFRSSYTETADSKVLISSEGVLAFGGVSVASPTLSTTPGGGGFIYIHNNQLFSAVMSTIAVVGCGFIAQAEIFIPVQLSSGLMYTKTGDCKASIYWDVVERNPNVIPRRVN